MVIERRSNLDVRHHASRRVLRKSAALPLCPFSFFMHDPATAAVPYPTTGQREHKKKQFIPIQYNGLARSWAFLLVGRYCLLRVVILWRLLLSNVTPYYTGAYNIQVVDIATRYSLISSCMYYNIVVDERATAVSMRYDLSSAELAIRKPNKLA